MRCPVLAYRYYFDRTYIADSAREMTHLENGDSV